MPLFEVILSALQTIFSGLDIAGNLRDKRERGKIATALAQLYNSLLQIIENGYELTNDLEYFAERYKVNGPSSQSKWTARQKEYLDMLHQQKIDVFRFRAALQNLLRSLEIYIPNLSDILNAPLSAKSDVLTSITSIIESGKLPQLLSPKNVSKKSDEQLFKDLAILLDTRALSSTFEQIKPKWNDNSYTTIVTYLQNHVQEQLEQLTKAADGLRKIIIDNFEIEEVFMVTSQIRGGRNG